MKKFTQTRDYCAESVEFAAKDIFLIQLHYIYYNIERNGIITKSDVENELSSRKNNGKQSLFSKMLNKRNQQTVPKHNSNLQLMLSLLNNLKLEYLDCETMKQIISNSNEIYSLYYRAEYENIQRDIFMQGHFKYMGDYEI